MNNESLKARIQEDMKTAMRAKEQLRLSTIRMLMAAIKQREIDEQKTLNDTDILAVINKMIKQRHESAKQYEAGNRQELADKENAEIEILQHYLPEQMSVDEIERIIDEVIGQTGAHGMKDMGKVMGTLQAKIKGQADMGVVSARVKTKLGG